MKRILMIGGLALVGYAIWQSTKGKAAAPATSQGTFNGGESGTSGGGPVALGLDAGQVGYPVTAAASSPSAIYQGGGAVDTNPPIGGSDRRYITAHDTFM